MIISCESVLGQRRKENQDHQLVYEVGDVVFLSLADGMGGHNGGRFASENALIKIKERLNGEKFNSKNIVKKMREAIDWANKFIYNKSKEDIALQGMGTTLILGAIYKNMLYVENIGDSRLYLYRNKNLTQITIDHSYVEELVRKGEITRLQAKNHPERNKITRALGTEEMVIADSFEEKLHKGDIIILCTDGLTKELSDKRITLEIERSEDYKNLATHLSNVADDEGGTDNITVITAMIMR